MAALAMTAPRKALRLRATGADEVATARPRRMGHAGAITGIRTGAKVRSEREATRADWRWAASCIFPSPSEKQFGQVNSLRRVLVFWPKAEACNCLVRKEKKDLVVAPA